MTEHKNAYEWLLETQEEKLPAYKAMSHVQAAVEEGRFPAPPATPEGTYAEELTEEQDRQVGEWFRKYNAWYDQARELLWKEQRILQVVLATSEKEIPKELEAGDFYRIRAGVEFPQWVLEFYRAVPFDPASTPHRPPLQPLAEEDLRVVFSMKPAQTVSRAARGLRGWMFSDDTVPRFHDPRNRHAVEYWTDGVDLDTLRDSVEQLSERSADVWHLITAETLELWKSGDEPPAFWIDVRQLCDAMGYKKHHKGGHKPEHVRLAAQALQDLANFHLIIPKGEAMLDVDPATGKRKRTKLTAQRRYKVLEVPVVDEVRDMFGNSYPMRWKIRAGEWIRGMPREFAPLHRSLVELPTQRAVDRWAKAIGIELTWQYRQDGRDTKTLKVRTLLEQSSFLADALTETRNRGRHRDNLEGALDVLQREGVCKAWQYHEDDETKAAGMGRGWFDDWLEARVIVTPPDEIRDSIKRIKNRHQRLEKAKERKSRPRKAPSE